MSDQESKQKLGAEQNAQVKGQQQSNEVQNQEQNHQNNQANQENIAKAQDDLAPKQEKEKIQDLQELFNSFDVDKSGTIELKEIQQIASKLGENLSQEQVQKIMDKLDINGDGKISFLEFKKWWERGRKGKMQTLVFLQADALKMVNFVTKHFQNAGITLGNQAAPKQFDSHKITVSFGQQKSNGFINLKIQNYIKGQKYLEKVQALQKVLPEFDNSKANFIIKMECENPQLAQENFEQLKDQIIQNLAKMIGLGPTFINMLVKIDSHITDKHLFITFAQGQMMGQMVSQTQGPLFQICEILGEDFYFNFMVELKFYASIDGIIGKNKDLFSAVLEGFVFRLEAETNSTVMKKLRKLLESKGQIQMLPFTLFRKTNLKFNLKSPENANDFLTKLGVKEVLESIPNSKDILQTFSPMTQQMKNEQQAPPHQFLGYKVSDFLQENASKSTQVMFLNKLTAICISINAENAGQVHKILFNKH